VGDPTTTIPTPTPTPAPTESPQVVAPAFEVVGLAKTLTFTDSRYNLPATSSSGVALKWSTTSTACSISTSGIVTWLSTGICSLNAATGSANITYNVQIDPRTQSTMQEVTSVQSTKTHLNLTVKWPGEAFTAKFCVGNSLNPCKFSTTKWIGSPDNQTMTADGDMYLSTDIDGLKPLTEYQVGAWISTSTKSWQTNLRAIKTVAGLSFTANGSTTVTLGQSFDNQILVSGDGTLVAIRATGLPSGVTLTRTSAGASITGKPNSTGVFMVIVKATDSLRRTTTLPLTFVVNPGSATPALISGAIFKPATATTTLVSWLSVSNAKQVTVKLDGLVVCKTAATSCTINQLLGPKSNLQLIATDLQNQDADRVLPLYVAPVKLVEVGTTNFALNSSILTTSQKAALNRVAADMEAKGFTQLTVYGYSDQTGSKAINDKNSLARATAIYNYLKTLLANKQLVVTLIGKGFKDPVASNTTAAGRAANRRAVVSIG